jgi:hypothetical protein
MSLPDFPGIPPIVPITLGIDTTKDVLTGPLQGSDGPRLLHAGPGSEWIPQGQGYDAVNGQVLSTFNDGNQVRLSFQLVDTECDPNPDTYSVTLGGADPDNPSADAPSKGGGVATDGEYIYVADTQDVYMYRREDVLYALQQEQAPTPMPPLAPDAEPAQSLNPYASGSSALPSVPAVDKVSIDAKDGSEFSASYLTLRNGALYVGDFTSTAINNLGGRDDPTRDATLRRYEVDPETGSFNAGRYDAIDAPKYAQGAVVTDTGVLFSTSLGSGVLAPADKLIFQATTNTPGEFSTAGSPRMVGELDHYAQGLNFVEGKLWITHESAADKYRGNVDNPHDHIQIHDIDSLDISADDLGVDTY